MGEGVYSEFYGTFTITTLQLPFSFQIWRDETKDTIIESTSTNAKFWKKRTLVGR